MRDRRAVQASTVPWRFPVAVETVAETVHFDLVADDEVRAALARAAGLRDLPRLEAHFDVTRHGIGGLRVAGRVSATVGQTCGVTLEPLSNEVNEDLELVFAESRPPAAKAGASRHGETVSEEIPSERAWGEPEPLLGGVVDLGAIASEFLILGLDPYPRKKGAVFETPQHVEPEDGPFAVLAQLAKGSHGR